MMAQVLIGLSLLGIVVLIGYIFYKIDEHRQFIWMNTMRRCKECNTYHHKDKNNDWVIYLKSSNYKNCDCYVFTKDKLK